MEFSVYFCGLTVILNMLSTVAFPLDSDQAIQELPAIKGYLETMPKNCRSLNFCSEPHQDYLQERIDKLLSRDKLMKGSIRENNFIDRDGFEGNSDCEFTQNWDIIYNIIDEDDKVRAVIQSEENFQQSFWNETCTKPNQRLTEPTDHFTKYTLQNNNIACRQVKTIYKFLVLSEDGTKFEMVSSKYPNPVSCDCVVLRS